MKFQFENSNDLKFGHKKVAIKEHITNSCTPRVIHLLFDFCLLGNVDGYRGKERVFWNSEAVRPQVVVAECFVKLC